MTNKNLSPFAQTRPSLNSLTTAAWLLPGLLHPCAHAAYDDEVDFQYSHYQEGKRNISGIYYNPDGSQNVKTIKSFNPIEAESLHGSSKISLTDRIKFAFDYLQDTWGGATPISTAPAGFNVNSLVVASDLKTIVGASPYLMGSGNTYLDKNYHPVAPLPYAFDPTTGQQRYGRNDQLTHVMSYASPETRKQGDFKLNYEGDDFGLSVGGGISIEDDYESRFGNLGGRWDFNQKQTTVNLDLSYTNSNTHAVADHDATGYLSMINYSKAGFDQVERFDTAPYTITVNGKRQDWSTHMGLTQVLGPNAIISGDIAYTRSTGYLSNPYKAVNVLFVDPDNQFFVPAGAAYVGNLYAFLEQRPEIRNQWSLGGKFSQFVPSLDAVLHLDYRFSADDWGVQTHAFEADWAQPLGGGWIVTPRIRYYSQDAASFYTPWLITQQSFLPKLDANGNAIALPYDSKKFNNPYNPAGDYSKYFSSDYRLSGFGALSGGITISKQFAKGLTLETGFEYYTHQGSLVIGGGGEGAYADFDYWSANAALKADLGAMSLRKSVTGINHTHSRHNHFEPAGILFNHMLPAGEVMIGYRYMWNSQDGDMLNGTNAASDQTIVSNGCQGVRSFGCYTAPDRMAMHMHMLDLMYAPTDWLTLMLMPQFVDMSMSMRALDGAPEPFSTLGHDLNGHLSHHLQNNHETGGLGDLGMYALFRLFDDGVHHLHFTAGLSAPTGDVDVKQRRNHHIDGGFFDYGMQLGSGTWDFKPNLTYTAHADAFSWGTQASATVRMEDRNRSGYRLGDLFQATAWGGYNLTDWLTASVRGIYTLQGRIHGQFDGPDGQFFQADGFTPTSSLKFGPMDYPYNYGGRFADIGFGLSAAVASGELAGNRLSVEWLQPVYTSYNGYQLDHQGALNFTWGYGF